MGQFHEVHACVIAWMTQFVSTNKHGVIRRICDLMYDELNKAKVRLIQCIPCSFKTFASDWLTTVKDRWSTMSYRYQCVNVIFYKMVKMRNSITELFIFHNQV